MCRSFPWPPAVGVAGALLSLAAALVAEATWAAPVLSCVLSCWGVRSVRIWGLECEGECEEGEVLEARAACGMQGQVHSYAHDTL